MTRLLYFLILTIYLSYLDQLLPPMAVMPVIYYAPINVKPAGGGGGAGHGVGI